jgi:Family of unknown function (DUF6069)
MTSTTIPPAAPGLAARAGAGRVWRGAVIAAVAATAAAELYAALIRAAGVPMRAGFLDAATASPLTASSFATGVVVCTFWGAVLATILAKKAARPARTFAAITVTLAALSLVVPAWASATSPATKAALAAAHILVAGIVIPILACHLRPARQGGG